MAPTNHPTTPDGRYFVVRGRLWRTSNPSLDPARRQELVDELMELLQEDAAALKCLTEVSRAREIAAEGTSADRQRAALAKARDAGADHEGQMRAVVHHLIEEFHADL